MPAMSFSQVGPVGGSTTIGGQGWGSGNSYAKDSKNCESEGDSSEFFEQNNFARTGKYLVNF